LYLSAGSDVSVVLLFVTKAFEAVRAIPVGSYPPFFCAAVSFVNVVKVCRTQVSKVIKFVFQIKAPPPKLLLNGGGKKLVGLPSSTLAFTVCYDLLRYT